jgi:hypothetical protein
MPDLALLLPELLPNTFAYILDLLVAALETAITPSLS